MEWLTIFFLVVIGLTAVALWRRVFRKEAGSLDGPAAVELPYERNSVLLSAAERSFLGVLEQALGEGYRVCPKVRVADESRSADRFLAVSGSGPQSHLFQGFDFILCRSTDLEIACAVELDDSTHQRHARQDRDMFLGEVCSVSSLPLLRFPAKEAYTVSDIRERLAACTESQQRRSTEGDHSLADEDVAIAQEAAPQCPKCSGAMVLRTVRKGSAAGQKFWGCADYPACRGTRRIMHNTGLQPTANPLRGRGRPRRGPDRLPLMKGETPCR